MFMNEPHIKIIFIYVALRVMLNKECIHALSQPDHSKDLLYGD